MPVQRPTRILGLGLALGLGIALSPRMPVALDYRPAPISLDQRLVPSGPEARPLSETGEPERPGFEAPHGVERCAACHLVGSIAAALPASALHLETKALYNGIAVHVVSADAAVRDQLWKSTVARGQLLAAIRSGNPVPLCDECRARLQRYRDLHIAAQRIDDGVLLLYTSSSQDEVRDLHLLLPSPRLEPLSRG